MRSARKSRPQQPSFHVSIEKALGLHEAYRRLGFPSEDIFVGLTDKATLYVTLKTRGTQLTIGVDVFHTNDEEVFAAAWLAAVNAVNAGTIPEPEMRRFLRSSFACTNVMEFVTALHEKGLRLTSDEDIRSWSR